MKGVPQDSIDIVARQKFNGDYIDMFETIARRKEGVLFDLTNGRCKIRFGFNFADAVFGIRDFFRRIRNCE